MTICHHTSDLRLATKTWMQFGGSVEHVRRTGEVRYLHPDFIRPLTVNGRRKDVPGKLMSRINQIIRFAISL